MLTQSPQPLLRSRTRALAFGLAGAVLLHAASLLVARWLKQPVPALPPARAASLSAIDLDWLPEVEGLSVEPGGGSPVAGAALQAAGEAPKTRLPSTVVPPPAPKLKAAAPPSGPTPNLEHGQEPIAPVEDLFALDALLTATESEQTIQARLKPRPAWAAEAKESAPALPMAGKAQAAARHFGVGAGGGGGPGGNGRRATGLLVDEANLFGGTSGAFHGVVCAIPKYSPNIKSLGQCTPIRELFTDNFNIPSRHFERGFPGLAGRNEWFAILYTGAFEVKRAGVYEFRLASDDGSILQIDGEVVVDNDGLHGPVARRGSVELTAGTHALRLRYFQGPRNLVALQLFVTPPDSAEQLFGRKF